MNRVDITFITINQSSFSFLYSTENNYICINVIKMLNN